MILLYGENGRGQVSTMGSPLAVLFSSNLGGLHSRGRARSSRSSSREGAAGAAGRPSQPPCYIPVPAVCT